MKTRQDKYDRSRYMADKRRFDEKHEAHINIVLRSELQQLKDLTDVLEWREKVNFQLTKLGIRCETPVYQRVDTRSEGDGDPY